MNDTNVAAKNDATVAVVGATSAVAQAAIRLWAQRGQALTLIARNAGELQRVAADARVRGAPAVATLVGDLTDAAFIAESVRGIFNRDTRERIAQAEELRLSETRAE